MQGVMTKFLGDMASIALKSAAKGKTVKRSGSMDFRMLLSRAKGK